MGLKILGTGSALPEKVVTNFDLMKTMDTSDEWIRERTGIGARHVVTGSNDTETTLGTNAARRAIEAAGLLACDIDLILVATCTADDRLPCVACKIQAALGAGQAAAFDINAACAGFLIGLSVAEGYLSSGAFANVLVVGTETVSKIIDWSDRGSAILFGDGAGACVVTRSDSAFTFALGADGEGGDALRCSHNSTVTMDGQAVYRFATRTVPKVINEVLAKAGMKASEVDKYVLHQANMRIIGSIAKGLKEPIEKFPTNIENVGNMSSASIPVLLDELVRDGKIVAGEKIVLAGFGAGLTYGACVMEY